jgi:hypothetical protein
MVPLTWYRYSVFGVWFVGRPGSHTFSRRPSGSYWAVVTLVVRVGLGERVTAQVQRRGDDVAGGVLLRDGGDRAAAGGGVDGFGGVILAVGLGTDPAVAVVAGRAGGHPGHSVAGAAADLLGVGVQAPGGRCAEGGGTVVVDLFTGEDVGRPRSGGAVGGDPLGGVVDQPQGGVASVGSGGADVVLAGRGETSVDLLGDLPVDGVEDVLGFGLAPGVGGGEVLECLLDGGVAQPCLGDVGLHVVDVVGSLCGAAAPRLEPGLAQHRGVVGVVVDYFEKLSGEAVVVRVADVVRVGDGDAASVDAGVGAVGVQAAEVAVVGAGPGATDGTGEHPHGRVATPIRPGAFGQRQGPLRGVVVVPQHRRVVACGVVLVGVHDGG